MTKVPMPREMLKRWLTRRPRMTLDVAEVPSGLRVYAIGDIHGRVDLLRQLHRRIIADAAQADPAMRKLLIYLGDYVDRGLYSREVLDVLVRERVPGFESVHLRGNHDHEFLEFLEDPRRTPRGCVTVVMRRSIATVFVCPPIPPPTEDSTCLVSGCVRRFRPTTSSSSWVCLIP